MVTSSSLDSWVRNLSKDDLKYLSQEFHNNVLDPVKHKGFYPYQYMCDFEKFKEQLPRKKKVLYFLDRQKNYWQKVWNKFGNKFEMKTMKYYHNLYLKCDVLLLADVFGKCRNNSWKDYESCLKWKTLSLNLFQILTCLYSLKKVQDPEFLIFLIDIARRIISI